MLEFENEYGHKYKRENFDDDLNVYGVNLEECLEFMLQPEMVTSFKRVFLKLAERYMTRYSRDGVDAWYHPSFQEWFQAECLGKFDFKKQFESQEKLWHEKYKSCMEGLEWMASEDSPTKSDDMNMIVYISNICDGHTIFKSDYFLEEGCDDRVVKYLTKRTWSDNSHYKEKLYDNDGANTPYIDGIYGASFLDIVTSKFKIKYEAKSGRGSNAYSQIRGIQEHWSK